MLCQRSAARLESLRAVIALVDWTVCFKRLNSLNLLNTLGFKNT